MLRASSKTATPGSISDFVIIKGGAITKWLIRPVHKLLGSSSAKRPGHGRISRVVGDVLSAGKGAGFSEARRTTGDERRRLIVAEAAEHSVLTGKTVIDAYVELPLVDFSHGRAAEVEVRVG